MLSEKYIYKKLIFPFLGGNGKQNNIRSRTETITIDGAVYFLKTSRIDLSPEAKILKTANKSVNGLSVRAVPFIYFCPDHNVLITEFVSGKSMFNEIWNNTSELRFFARSNGTDYDWVTIFKKICEWVSLFHAFSMNTNGSIAKTIKLKNNLVEDINRKIHNIHLSSPSIFTKKEWGLLNNLVFMGDNSDWQSLPTANIHGDLTLSNLIIDNEKVFVLDFADTREGFIIEDIVRLWTVLWEVSQCGRNRYQVVSPVLKQILSSCCDVDIKSTKPFMFLRIFNAVIRIHESLTAPSLLSWSTRLTLKKLAKVQLHFLKNEVLC